MRPYCAQFGLTKEKVKSVSKLEDLIMDQYARDCGFEPTDSWVLIVRPSGDCEFTPLGPGDPHWCCERADDIRAGIGPAIGVTPPYASREGLETGDLDQRIQTIREEDLNSLTTLPVSAGRDPGPSFRDYNPFRNSPFNNTFNNAFPNAFPNVFRNK
jgi:hypothetical protein